MDLLFYSQGSLHDYFEKRKVQLKDEVESTNRDYLLKVSEEDFCRYLVAKYQLKAPVMHPEERYGLEPAETKIDVRRDPTRIVFDPGHPVYVPCTEFTVVVPFDGDSELFHFTPSTYTLNPPQAVVKESEVHLTYRQIEHNLQAVQHQYQNDIDSISKYLDWVAGDVARYNQSVESLVRQVVSARKARLLADMNLVSGLGIPIKRRDGAPLTYSIPSVQRKPKVERPDVKPGAYRPEPTLEIAEYEQILNIMDNMVKVMERSPRAFVRMNEEDLRTHFLVQLNGQYEGRATGETFNSTGKTDILIREDDRNAFIAECKFWRGEKAFTKTIDQLLGYTSWRDTKTAIVLFNRTQDFTSVLRKIPEVVRAHSCFKREQGQRGETSFRYVFHQPGDPNRELLLTVMAFNIPAVQ